MAIPLKEAILSARRLPRSDDILMARAELLAQEDRDLVEAIFVRGQSAKSVARMVDVDVRLLRQRVNRLARRMASRRFLNAARSLPYLARPDAMLARLRFCEGRTIRQLQARLEVSEHVLRRWLDHVTAQIATIRQFAKRGAEQDAEDYRRYWSRESREA